MKRNTINKELGSLWIFHINNDISGSSQDNLPFSKGTSWCRIERNEYTINSKILC